MTRLRKFLIGFLTTFALIGVMFITATPAEAATYVKIYNFTEKPVYVNGKRLDTGESVGKVKRKTMKVKSTYCAVLQGFNKDGSPTRNRSYLHGGITYKGGVFKSNKKLDDGSANSFAVLQTACRKR